MDSLKKKSSKVLGWLRGRKKPGSSGGNAPHTRLLDSTDEFLAFLRRKNIPKITKDEAPAGIFVTPWCDVFSPWVSIAQAVGLARRGRRVVLLWNDTPFPVAASVATQNEAIARALGYLVSHFEVIRISELEPAPPEPNDEAAINYQSELNLIWRLRGAPATPEDLKTQSVFKRSFTDSLALFRAAVRKHPFRYIVSPGGIYGPSSMLVKACEEAGIRYTTYDSNLGVMQYAHNGSASQQADLDIAYRELLKEGPEVRAKMVSMAKALLEERMHGRDLAAYQHAKPSEDGPKLAVDVMMPMNVEWDSAALGRHAVFANSEEWIRETVAYVLEKTDATIAVRQHPSERRQGERSSFDVRAILAKNFGDNSRLHFIAAEDDVNSYDLMSTCKIVLPYVSTIGIEAAALGKPVLPAGRNFAAELGFFWFTTDRDKYFETLDRGIRGELPLLPDQVEKAWLCYYLTPVANRVWTNYTPQPTDFPHWVQRDPNEMFDDPAVSDILEAIDSGVPLGVLRHRRNFPEPTHV